MPAVYEREGSYAVLRAFTAVSYSRFVTYLPRQPSAKLTEDFTSRPRAHRQLRTLILLLDAPATSILRIYTRIRSHTGIRKSFLNFTRSLPMNLSPIMDYRFVVEATSNGGKRSNRFQILHFRSHQKIYL